jgi:hypothetical protein
MASKSKIAGKQYQIETQNTAIDVDDLEGHQVGVAVSKGINFEGDFTGEQVTNFYTYDIVMGNGTFKGYGTHFHSNGDVHYNKYQGTITTEIVNDKPLTTFEGTWEVSGGTGEYEDVRSEGTFKAKAIAPDISLMEWEGELTK